jgi:hypothetical protein
MMHAISFGARVLAGAAAVVFAGSMGMAAAANSKPNQTSFQMFPQAAEINCLTAGPGAPTPQVRVQLERHELNDTADIYLKNFKPNLGFDLFTIQHSPQTATGTPDANPSVGLAWYQTDVQVGSNGSGHVHIRTVLLDQIFGVDKDVALPPTNTFHMGFWFNNPTDAQRCGFTGTTPFNGEHNAGPLAFVTRPNATTNLGPLCTDPISGSSGFTCNP